MKDAEITTEKVVRSGKSSISIRNFGTPRPDRNLLLIHGACEHGGRYWRFANPAVERGWGVIVPDLRGHGKSSGIRCHVGRFEDYLDDLGVILREEFPDRPPVIVAHSTGALIAARFLQRNPEAATAAVLLSPYVDLHATVPVWKRQLGQLLSSCWPTFRFSSNIKGTDLCRDPEILKERETDEHLFGSITARWFFEIENAQRRVFEDADKFRTPVFVIQAGDDKIVSARRSKEWFDQIASEDKKYIELPEHKHELLNEPDRDETAKLILDWLDERISSSRV